jgi:AraC-like DNA-binding protein
MDRIFDACFGRTVKKEMIRLRIQHIQELLATTGMSAKQITAVAGFRTLTHMSRVFQQECNITLREFRTQLDFGHAPPWVDQLRPGRLVLQMPGPESPGKRKRTRAVAPQIRKGCTDYPAGV